MGKQVIGLEVRQELGLQKQIIVSQEDLDKYLNEGYRYVAALQSGKAIIQIL